MSTILSRPSSFNRYPQPNFMTYIPIKQDSTASISKIKCHHEEFKKFDRSPYFQDLDLHYLSALLEVHKWTGPPEQVKLVRSPA